eukprot:CAMPEP_0197413472 /NCGR_PEP_ID=MMETSP1170-20131217/334_1 /TAXON_ID=54406 /ORGANISM="Sarcinochrysis sp, Strain CCMP770" /LENGTH=203 /DNA_ID=CAMNT_0042940053 /DNA_START=14 /DNA_END=625 /DNA_ORIENTATION=+
MAALTTATEDDGDPSLETARRDLQAAMATRDALEAEASAITSELESPGPSGGPAMGVKTPLVDSEGFPRADVDVHRARHLRHRLACIQTDHKAAMKTIERLLPVVLAPRDDQESHQAPGRIFARITQVRAGSPASRAGLRVDDAVVAFGDAVDLADLKAWTVSHVNVEFPVVVDRGGHRVNLRVMPQAWAGEGLLGCVFVPAT